MYERVLFLVKSVIGSSLFLLALKTCLFASRGRGRSRLDKFYPLWFLCLLSSRSKIDLVKERNKPTLKITQRPTNGFS